MIKFDKINVTLGGKHILKDISFSLTPHKITALIGKNGSGKSTLVSCVTNGAGYTGEILYGGRNISLMSPRERAQLIAVLPQSLPKTSLTVYELAAMGRTPYLDIGRRMQESDRLQIEKAIDSVNMCQFSHMPVNTLSGGEKQKAYLAMTLAQNTRVIILDEPTTYMDMENEANFLELIVKLKTQHKKTILLVMHDLTKAVEIADDIAVIDGGKLAFFGSSDACIESGVIEKTFGVNRSSFNAGGENKTLYYR